jgi:hypothetical protein
VRRSFKDGRWDAAGDHGERDEGPSLYTALGIDSDSTMERMIKPIGTTRIGPRPCDGFPIDPMRLGLRDV